MNACKLLADSLYTGDMHISQLPTPLLKAAVKIREQIDNLTAELMSIVGRDSTPATTRTRGKKSKSAKKGKRTLSPEARAKIAAGQARRWAKVKGKAKSAASAKASAKAKPAKAGKRNMSPEARERIAEAQRRRWAKAKAKAK